MTSLPRFRNRLATHRSFPCEKCAAAAKQDFLTCALKLGHHTCLAALLHTGVDLDDLDGRNVNRVETLLKSWADVNTKVGEFGETTLIMAAIEGCDKCVETLIRAGANVNVQD